MFPIYTSDQELFYQKLKHDEITILSPIYPISTKHAGDYLINLMNGTLTEL